ncbi:MAG: DUF115 domain-containing protein [Nitrospinae bacterium]|nr:DUF115 domain-containing protein [Nitrospinota bacterium]
MVDDKTLYEVKSRTQANFGALWLRNFAAIKGEVSRRPRISALFDTLEGVPAIVVGAGPSLDKNLRLLKLAEGRALIICVDTILSALQTADIAPSVVVTLDPQPETALMFSRARTESLTLAAPTIISPRALAAWKGEVVFYHKYAPDIPPLVQVARAAPQVGYLIPGGSVLSVGLDLAFRMGCDPIAFAGQDLSYPPGAAYSRHTVYGDAGFGEMFREKMGDMVTSADIFGRVLPTQKSLFVTKQWMEWAFGALKREKPAAFYNCTEGGIVTQGCRIVTLREWLARFARERRNIAWAMKKALSRGKR